MALIATAAAASTRAAHAAVVVTPVAAVPASPGTGLDARWATGTNLVDLTASNALLARTAALTSRVGPVNLTNGLRSIGDFPAPSLMPLSPGAAPPGTGENVAVQLRGAWAVRSPGTYTLLLGSDDGSALRLASATAMMSQRQSFRRASVVVSVDRPGLIPIEIDYFNGIQEGRIELAVARGDVAVVNPYAPPPATFGLVPATDLYPLDALAPGGGGGSPEAGAPRLDGGPASGDGGPASGDGGPASGDASGTDAASSETAAASTSGDGDEPVPPDESHALLPPAVGASAATLAAADVAVDDGFPDGEGRYSGSGCTVHRAVRLASPSGLDLVASFVAAVVMLARSAGRRHDGAGSSRRRSSRRRGPSPRSSTTTSGRITSSSARSRGRGHARS